MVDTRGTISPSLFPCKAEISLLSEVSSVHLNVKGTIIARDWDLGLEKPGQHALLLRSLTTPSPHNLDSSLLHPKLNFFVLSIPPSFIVSSGEGMATHSGWRSLVH